MKKILIVALSTLLCQGVLMAQKKVSESDVKVNYVKDFQRQVKNASDVQWWQLDESTFRVNYRDAERSRQAMVFGPKGSETHYMVDDYYPHAVTDTVAHLFPKYKIREVWVRKVRSKLTYQARIAKVKGFLWWKKESDSKVLNWEVDGKYLGE